MREDTTPAEVTKTSDAPAVAHTESRSSTDAQPPWSDAGDVVAAPAQPVPSEPGEATGRTDGRDSKGRFAKGYSGNRSGAAKPNKTGSLSKALDGIVDRSILAKTLWNLAQGMDAHGRKYKRPNLSVQMAAVSYVYDRLEGKPLMQVRHETDDLPTFIIMHGRDAKAAGATVEGEARELPEGESAT